MCVSLLVSYRAVCSSSDFKIEVRLSVRLSVCVDRWVGFVSVMVGTVLDRRWFVSVCVWVGLVSLIVATVLDCLVGAFICVRGHVGSLCGYDGGYGVRLSMRLSACVEGGWDVWPMMVATV